MKAVQNQSFWREILDNLPSWVLVFRIDEHEQAHLIFANRHTTDHLGFKPEDWVLKVETESHAASEVEKLIDEIANLSKREGDEQNGVVLLTDRWGKEKGFDFSFELYKNKAQNSYQINVELRPQGQISTKRDKSARTDEHNIPKAEKVDKQSEDVASEVMKAIHRQLPFICEQNKHILIVGPTGVGKKMLVRQMLNLPVMKGYNIYYIGSGWKNEVKTELDSLESKVASPALLCVDKLAEFSVDDQKKILELVQQDDGRVIATSAQDAQSLIEREKLWAPLYYELGFHAIPIPSLRNRKQDIVSWVRKFAAQLEPLLSKKVSVSDDLWKYILDHDWKENYLGLRRFMVQAVREMNVEGGVIEIPASILSSSISRQEDLFNEGEEPMEILPFDEMNRRYLKSVLLQVGGKVYGEGGAAELLDLPPTTLQSKLKKLGIK